jgi:hypothetical protein
MPLKGQVVIVIKTYCRGYQKSMDFRQIPGVDVHRCQLALVATILPNSAYGFQTAFSNTKMSFQALSEKLATLQESNAQLKDLIDRLATIKFQPGSIPLDNEEGNVIAELTAEIQQTIRDQDDDFKLLQEEVKDLESGRPGSELELQKSGLEYTVERAIKELKTCVF